jgi:mannose-6-phosphate isomerase-like protein (cupin superfamily)
MSDQPQPPRFDPADFSIAPYVKRVDKPWGYELHWVPADAPYIGKVLHIHAGARLSLQLHDEKQESWFLMSGKAAVIWENERGELVQTELQAGQGYSTKLGQRHRLVGLTNCDVIEASTPELGTTWRLEDDYARPHETPEQRDIERNQ